MSGILFKEAVDRVIVKCGQRDDIRPLASEAVNSALVVISNYNETPFSFESFELDLPVEAYGVLELPSEIEVVLGVGYVDTDTSNVYPLIPGGYKMITDNQSTETVPTKYMQVGSRLYVYPLLDKPFRLRILGSKEMKTLTDDNAALPIPTSLVPAVIMLAASLVRIDLGDLKVAGTLRNFASMFGSIKVGPEARMKGFSPSQVKVRTE